MQPLFDRFRSLFFGLCLSLVALAPALASPAARAPSPEADWQIGVIALVGIGIVGAGLMIAGNARRRREALDFEQETRENAARAQAAITGGEPEDDAPDDLHAMARDIEKLSEAPDQFRPRKPRQNRPPENAGERDQNMPGINLQRTRSR